MTPNIDPVKQTCQIGKISQRGGANDGALRSAIHLIVSLGRRFNILIAQHICQTITSNGLTKESPNDWLKPTPARFFDKVSRAGQVD